MEQLWSWSKVPHQSHHFCPDINDSLALIHSFHTDTHTHTRAQLVFSWSRCLTEHGGHVLLR